MAPESEIQQPLSSALLRRRDQAAVALLVLIAMIATGAWWCWHGGLRGRLVKVEKAQPQRAAFAVDINTADWPEVAELPGIGRSLAAAIIRSREQDGPFHRPDDLLRVRGIGMAKLDALRPYLTFSGRVPGAGNDKVTR